ncbi:MAG: hypothetical protein ACJ74O_09965 [Frankiaceae bacterium]
MITFSEQAPEQVTQQAPEQVPAQAPEQVTEQVPEQAPTGKRRRARTTRTTRSATPAETIRLHPLLRGRLITDDLRRMEILRVHDSLAVDVIVRNRPLSGR